MAFNTEQEEFWSGEFGTDYIERNRLTSQVFSAKANMWSAILGRMSSVPSSVLELGTNIGNNLHVLNMLLPDAQLAGVEINPAAVAEVRHWGRAEIFHASILDFAPDRTWDLVFTSGVLIHINPESLSAVYALIHKAAASNICIAEYYSPRPEEIPYRGHSNKLYRRDFAGEILDGFPDICLRGYGFVYHRDPLFPLGDLTWFLMEKR